MAGIIELDSALELLQVARRSELAQALAANNIFEDTAQGLASGEAYFSVPSAELDEYLVLYRNVAGAAVVVDTYPNKTGIINARDAAEAFAADVLSVAQEVSADRLAAQQAVLDAGDAAQVVVDGAMPGIESRIVDAQHSPQTIKDIGDNYTPIANLIRLTGDAAYNTLYGVQREIQYFAADEVNRKYYTIHDNDDPTTPLTMVTRYPMDGTAIDRIQEAVSLPSVEFGHQGLAVENLANNAVKLWCTDGTDKMAVIRFDFADGSGPVNKQKFTLFTAADGFNTDVSCFDGFSSNGAWLIGHAKIVGVDTVVARIWNKAAVIAAGPGDHSQTWIHEVNLGALYAPALFPVQGLASDGKSLFGVSGGNGFAVDPRRMYKYSIADNKVLEADHNVMVGSVEALADGTGISYEPEGLQFLNVNGVSRLCVGIRSGSSLTPSVFRIHAIGVKPAQSANVKASGVAWTWRRMFTAIGQVYLNSAAYCLHALGVGVNLRLGTQGVDDWEIEATARGWRPMTHLLQKIGQSTRMCLEVWSKIFVLGSGVIITSNAGSPEGVVTASPGSICTDTTNGEAYIKKSGTLAVGWKLITHAA